MTCIVHPDASRVVESDKFGGIRVQRGVEAGYFVSIAKKPKDEYGAELPWTVHRTEWVKL